MQQLRNLLYLLCGTVGLVIIVVVLNVWCYRTMWPVANGVAMGCKWAILARVLCNTN
jgi:uncharacterized membrane protein